MKNLIKNHNLERKQIRFFFTNYFDEYFTKKLQKLFRVIS